MMITSENIFEESRKGNLEVLKSDLADKFSDRDEGWRWTPLHYLADSGKLEVLEHPSVNKVFSVMGNTPLNLLILRGKITKKFLKKKYPWFKFKEDQDINYKLLDEILKTSQSVRFILEE